MLYQTFCTLNYHFGYTFVVLRKFVESRINNFYVIAFDSLFDICYLLRALINQQNDHMHVRIIGLYSGCYFFQ